jgi:small subunit ribosomal protein S1
MSEERETPSEDFATLFAREQTGPALEVGQVVKGRVILVGAENIFVDVGGKGEAWIERGELTDDEGRLQVGVGDEVEATVVSTGDEIRLSHKLRQGAHAREALAIAASTGVPIEGRVAAVIKGGYEVTVAGLRAFCPFSQMDVRRVETAEDFVGRVLEFRVITYGERGRNIVLSRRQVLEERGAKIAEETLQKVVPGAVLPGTVVSLADFGAFVDLGGVQGLVPVSEVSHSRVARPSDRLRVGEPVMVKVLKVDEEKKRISLSLKALEGDPWAVVPGRLRERQVVRARAVRATEFGVFVRLGPGQTGLIPNAELGTARGTDPRKTFPSGSEVKVLVLAIEEGGRRIRLSREKALAHEEQAETQAYLRDTAKRDGGFGLTLGERLRQTRKP